MFEPIKPVRSKMHQANTAICSKSQVVDLQTRKSLTEDLFDMHACQAYADTDMQRFSSILLEAAVITWA
jgi:hypothetical protein